MIVLKKDGVGGGKFITGGGVCTKMYGVGEWRLGCQELFRGGGFRVISVIGGY